MSSTQEKSQVLLNKEKRIRKRKNAKKKSVIGNAKTPPAKESTKDKKAVYGARPKKYQLAPGNIQPAITITVPLQGPTLYGICQSYVSAALARGWQANKVPGTAYYASVYLVNVFLAYVKAATPQSSTLPRWVQCFGQALAPKIVRCAQGYASYCFATSTIPDPYEPSPNVNIGAPTYGYEYLLYEVGSNNVNFFPVAVPPGGYTVDKGRDSFSSLAQFMQQEDNPMSTIVPLYETTWRNNVSAFAMTANAEGLGNNVAGGFFFQANLEVPVWTPTLSVFANILSSGAINPVRYGLFVNVSSGDALWCSTMFHSLSTQRALSAKGPTLFHAVDFLEFADVLAQWVQKMQQTAALDTGASGTINGDWSKFQCPLTLQEMTLILRNEIAYMYCKTQVGVQSIYPRAPSTAQDNEFVPFIMSSNTVPLTCTGMRLPLIFCENIKSLQARAVQTGKQTRWFVPILGKYYIDVLESDDYKFSPSEGSPVQSFASEPSVKRKKIVKGVEVWDYVPEVAIDLIDGAAGSDYLFINDQTRLKTLTALWNEWVNRLSTYSTTLSTLAGDMGVNVCCGIGQTQHWVPVSATATLRERDFVDERVASRLELSNTVYTNRHAIAISAHDKIYEAAFNSITSSWVLPINKAVAGSNLAAQSFFQRQQLMSAETYSITSAGEDDGQSLASKHSAYASMLVRAPTAAPSEIEHFFIEQSKRGTGGILSGLAASWLGKTFGPTAGSIAGTVAELLPI